MEEERQEKEEKLQELLRLAQEGNITAETEKIIGEICEKETQEDGDVQEEGRTVLTVFPADRMKICVPVREQEILSVKEGQKALVEVNAVPGTQLEGVVSQVGTQSEYAGGAVVYMAEVTVKTDGEEDFREGMSAAVRIQTERRRKRCFFRSRRCGRKKRGSSRIRKRIRKRESFQEGWRFRPETPTESRWKSWKGWKRGAWFITRKDDFSEKS